MEYEKHQNLVRCIPTEMTVVQVLAGLEGEADQIGCDMATSAENCEC